MPRRVTRRRATAGVALLTTGALLLAACSGSPAAESPSDGAPDPDATLRVRLTLEPTNLDIRNTVGASLDQALIDNVYQGLVTLDQDNNIVEGLASEYAVSDDGLTYTFTLREGVLFHDGSALTVDDVVASLTSVREAAAASEDPESFDNVAAISAPDAATVTVTLVEPNNNFLFVLTGSEGLVFKANDTTDFETEANGTGPFTVEQWAQGQSLVLSRSESYWGEQAGVAEVSLDYIGDQATALNAAITGEVDVALEIDPEFRTQFEDGGFSVVGGQTTDEGTLAFNNERAPLDDVRVREALRLAIDHDALIEAIGGTGETLFGPIPELDPGYEDLSDVVSYDPERARELLAEAGQEDLELTLTTLSDYATTIPTFLVSAFNDIGVSLSVDSVDFATWGQQVFTDRDYDLSFIRHVEPRDFGNWANPGYYFAYDNAEVQDLYAQALATTDDAEADALLAQAARIVSEDHAGDWLFVATPLAAVAGNVRDFPRNSLNVRLPLAGVTVASE